MLGITVVLAGLGLTAFSYWSAIRMPVIREASVVLPGWPAGEAPITVALLSDIHIGNAATDSARFERIAAAVTARRPDLIVLAGDFIAGHEPADAALAPGLVAGLRRLRAPLGVLAVPGNHDHWTGIAAVRRALADGGVAVLANAAVGRGPIVVGGLDDWPTRYARVTDTVAAMRAAGPALLLVSHSPDVAPLLPNDVTLLLAGHSHCGQIVLPFVGAPVQVTRPRYRCGVIREGARTTIVTAGTGTSGPPLRFGAPPDVWLVRVGP